MQIFFVNKFGLLETTSSKVLESGETYLSVIRKLPKEVRAMSIFSREQELPGVFERVLKAKNWDKAGLKEFRYYLKKHILLDTEEGGHAALVDDFLVDNRMEKFYRMRIKMYQSIPRLFLK